MKEIKRVPVFLKHSVEAASTTQTDGQGYVDPAQVLHSADQSGLCTVCHSTHGISIIIQT